MKRNTRIMIAAASLATLGLLAWAFAPRPLAVEVATVAKGRYEQAVVEDGRTRLRDRYAVTAPLAGRLARITLREGDAVQAGQLLAEITPQPAPMLDARTRAELQAREASARAGVQRAMAGVGQQKVALAQARIDLARSEQLAQQGFVAPTRLDSERLAVQAAQQGLTAAEQAQHVAEHEAQQARAALQASAPAGSATGAPFAVRAPVAGRVLKVAQTSETSVAPGTPLLELGDTARLEIVAELLTTEALPLAAGAPVRIERWGGAGELQARVRQVEPAGFTKVSALGVEEQRVNVLIELTSPPAQWRALGDGYRVGVRVFTQQRDGVLMVPVSAVFPRPGQAAVAGQAAVFVLADGHARLRPVTLGGRNGQQAWVGSGLAEGETVIVYPPAAVADGVRVKARMVPALAGGG
ncbi:efflux RND transporter periplasmic adaptor subunit [Aquabacterium sp. OR-4]|uniref:efflux RND transporter periplasmic adaptor subunit n=1 Tax=Aquabacterium sp. OR-4 TaxID=2978127 RepID=UPI0028C83F13|nr:HlyD family efflux transporter periplasmic adaptor subunit [Aquabacterium sp. OR-4]MDT7836818.1 HlyD family efflux transporter periplasmic adaptor subunit [Aquabacterium sp. OR-4]